jgi:hypothetical protein
VEEMMTSIENLIAPGPEETGFVADMRRIVFGLIIDYRTWKCRRCHEYQWKHDPIYRMNNPRQLTEKEIEKLYNLTSPNRD